MKNFLYLLFVFPFCLQADEANIVNVVIRHSFDDVYNFDVTVKHQDEGWNHFANGWEVVSPVGKVLAVRVLRHPHKNEQPFTRSMPVQIPQGISEVTIRAHDSVHEYGGCEVTLKIPAARPENRSEDGS